MRLHAESPAEYFRALVEAAMERQRLGASELTSYYLVNLLSGFVRPDQAYGPFADVDGPLALALGRALESAGGEQRARLRHVGDISLLTSGYFSDSLRRKLVDVDYYVALGEYAYGSLGRDERDGLGAVFAELARKFGGFVDILAEVSEASGLTSDTDLLRLYEKWLRTGSRVSGERLVSRGILPNSSITSRRIQ
jgi:hypothetical protein